MKHHEIIMAVRDKASGDIMSIEEAINKLDAFSQEVVAAQSLTTSIRSAIARSRGSQLFQTTDIEEALNIFDAIRDRIAQQVDEFSG